MLKGYGRHGTERRPDRIAEFTDEWLKTLPEPKSYGDIFWDTVCDRLTVIKAKRGVLFRIKLRKSERQTLGIVPNSNLTPIGYNLTVAEARAKYREFMTAIEKGTPLYTTALGQQIHHLLKPRVNRSERTYEGLMSVLMDAYGQAATGKGHERHNDDDLPFEDQDMQRIAEATSDDFMYGQALKKILEARRLPRWPRKRAELLGAIVYLAGVIVMEDKRSTPTGDEREAAMQELANLSQQMEKRNGNS